MDGTTPESMEQGPKKGIVIIVIIILLGTNAILLWSFFDKKSSFEAVSKNLDIANQDKAQLQGELDAIKVEREKLRAENSQFKDQLSKQDSILKIKEAKIQHLIAIGGPAQLAQAKAEIAKLKEMNELYTLQLDSLHKANQQLAADVQNLNSNLAESQSKNANLTKQVSNLSNKIAAGAILATANVATEALRIKSSGKELPTSKAKQVGKIHTKFTIVQNRVIDSGPVDIYVRVTGPDGNVMSSSQQSFTAGGEAIVYTVKQTVDYNNQDTPVDVEWARGTQFTKGTYTIDIYHGGQVIGRSTIELK